MARSLPLHSHPLALTELPSIWDYWSLFKPRVMGLVVFTAMAGAYLSPGSLHPYLYFVSIVSIAVGAGASGALNMWYDRDIDALMDRTKKRSIPAGKVAADEALILGVTLSIGSVVTLGFAANYFAAFWLAFTIWFYVVVYTIGLKRYTPQNIVIGGAAGAFPPVIGWFALSSEWAFEPFILFLIIFLWTPPHFWALGLVQQEDYKKAKIPMLPSVASFKTTMVQIGIYSLLMVVASGLLYVIGFSGLFYLIAAGVLGICFLGFVTQLWIRQRRQDALRLFKFSIFYLFMLFVSMIVDHWMR